MSNWIYLPIEKHVRTRVHARNGAIQQQTRGSMIYGWKKIRTARPSTPTCAPARVALAGEWPHSNREDVLRVYECRQGEATCVVVTPHGVVQVGSFPASRVPPIAHLMSLNASARHAAYSSGGTNLQSAIDSVIDSAIDAC